MSGIFEGMDVAQDAAKESDVLGGGFAPLETAIYGAVIKSAYLHTAASGARAVVFAADINGKEYRETMYYSSNTNNGLKTYFIDNTTGKKRNLPGFATIDSLCIIAAGMLFTSMTPVPKIQNIYNYDLSKDVPTEVQMLDALTDKPVYLAIQNVLENKQIKNTVTGKYVDTAKTRNVNNIVKVFHPTTKMTAVEIAEGSAVAAFYESWETTKTGITIDKVKTVAADATGVAPGQASIFTPVVAPAPVAVVEPTPVAAPVAVAPVAVVEPTPVAAPVAQPAVAPVAPVAEPAVVPTAPVFPPAV